MHSIADDFTAQVERLTAETVNADRWQRFLTAYTAPSSDGKRARANADTKHRELSKLWHTDERVQPWRGTAYGVIAAANTYHH